MLYMQNYHNSIKSLPLKKPQQGEKNKKKKQQKTKDDGNLKDKNASRKEMEVQFHSRFESTNSPELEENRSKSWSCLLPSISWFFFHSFVSSFLSSFFMVKIV